MEKLIPVVNKLQDIFQRCGLANPIDLPQIVVVGAQSSGKSSVLEAIVGFDFLPRGSGVVTRRPTLIQLHKLSADGSQKSGKQARKQEMWAEFLHCPGQKFRDVSHIQREILSETERVAGKNKRLAPSALVFKVFSTEVVDLTLVDLPGLTRVPVGDQPVDIEKLVRSMIYSYIEKPNSVILAVHPANTDLATSDALQMARKVDPDGVRTLGVITKLDLMDAGTNALEILQGRVIPLRRGYVGVVNRSQAALDGRSTVAESHAAERDFFKSHPIYAPHASKMGSPYLASLLSGMLMEHIRNVLPHIRKKLSSHLGDVRAQLSDLGPVLGSDGDDASASLLHVLTRYAAEFAATIDGRPAAPLATSELAGGARISYIFHERFGRTLAAMDPFEGLGTDEIRTALRNATGHRTPLFIPESAFELLVKRQIVRFLEPSVGCVELVYDELTRLAGTVEGTELARFQRLREEVADATLRLLRELKGPTVDMVRALVDMEMGYINTWHPDFVGGRQALTASVQPAGGREHHPADGMPHNSIAGARAGEPSDSWVEKNLLGARSPTVDDPLRPANPPGASTLTPRYQRVHQTPNYMRAQPRGLATAAAVSGGAENGYGGVRSTAGGGSQAGLMPNQLRVSRTEKVSEDERQELSILRILLESYFNIVRKRLQDMVPKAIITFLVTKCKDSLQSVLVSKLYKPDAVARLMIEDDDTAQRRKDLIGIADMLEEALVQVGEVRDVH